MFIPQSPTAAVSLFARDIESTAKSFRSWDTCQKNKTCHIVAIVGIVLASLIALWILCSLLRCVRMGVDCFEAFCCCCRNAHRDRYVEQPQPYHNNMYRAPPMAPAEPTYQPMSEGPYTLNGYYNRYDGGYKA